MLPAVAGFLSGKVRAGGRLNLARLLIEAARPYTRPVPPVARPAPVTAPRPAEKPPVASVPVAAPPAVMSPAEPRVIDGIRIEAPGGKIGGGSKQPAAPDEITGRNLQ